MASHSPKCIRSVEKSCEDSKDSKEARMNAINNNVLRVTPRRQACLFAEWFRRLVDSDRSSLSLYLADDAILQWFGRTIKMKKKISGFLKYDMHCTSHRFTSVEVCSTFSVRGEKEEAVLQRLLFTYCLWVLLSNWYWQGSANVIWGKLICRFKANCFIKC